MTQQALMALRARIALTRLTERPPLDREWQRLRTRQAQGRDIAEAFEKLAQRIDASILRLEALRNAPLKLEYDPELPISAHRDEFLKALEQHQVIILCGATGSGKSTQLPKLCLQAGRGVFGLIGHTQPRRIAARALANRVAEELVTTVGGAVGYQVRFTDHTGPQCRIKLMTDGILLRELEADRDLRRYDTLIIDEAHERSLNIDLLLGVLKQLLMRRPDLKLIITSATIDPQKFSSFFNGAPVIEVSGRSYPVEVRYRPLVSEDEESVEMSLPQGVLAAVEELERDARGMAGDVLVFLPGEKQIRETAKVLQDARLRNTEILPLYARLSVGEQERIFTAHHNRRIVLATNVAETSLTVPGVRFVVDSGLARISRYSVRGKIQRLPIEKIARASADQRKGRCGRVAEGICIRLYDEDDFNVRDEFTAPEILRTNLASVILKLATLGLPDPGEFPFIDPPELKLINDGYRLLQELKAVDESRRITSLGKQIAALPLDPRLARMLLAADHHRCLREMLVIAAFLSIQDPRERPQEAQQKADQHHASHADARSDFLTMLIVWQRFHDSAQQLSGNQLRKWCREQFLSFIRLREWQEVHSQLREAVDELGLRPNQVDANYAELHQAILTGFLGGIGTLEENREYLGARSTRFVIAPGTPLASKPPKWVVAASLVETTRMYARMVAAVEPQWIEAAGEHLLKRSYSEPHWEAQRGFVAAFEHTALYGLILSAKRRVNYASVAPEEAREIFVRAALVEGQSDIKADFLTHNRALLKQVEAFEARIRRRDVLVDEQAQVAFYLQHLPAHVHSATALHGWLREQRLAVQELRMTLRDLMRRELNEFDAASYPDYLDCDGNRLPLRYKFEPADIDDGVTLTVPEPLLTTLDDSRISWCVPGWRLETITEMLRALPKTMRKHFVPVPQFAARALQELGQEADLSTSLSRWITQISGTAFTVDELHALSIPVHLKPWLRIEDLNGRLLSQGRDLRQLLRETRKVVASFPPVALASAAQTGQLRSWECGDLPVEREVQRNGVRFKVYPALQDRHDSVAVVELNSAIHAEQVMRGGVLRLLVLALPQQYKFARQQFSGSRELMLLGQGIGSDKPLADVLAERALRECFLPEGQTLPRSKQDFDRLVEQHRAGLNEVMTRLSHTLLSLFKEWRAVRQALLKLNAPVFKDAVVDIEVQLSGLLPNDFLQTTEQPWFGHLPRYMKALTRRIERLSGNVARDTQLLQQIQPYMNSYRQLLARKSLQQHELNKLKWMIEEFRVSLFAQELKTAVPVSAKRLSEQVELARKEAG
ncbi:MAG: ATP-dependent RNA helicase HrpA [Steroidobacteraceae bacterium]